MSNIRQSVPRRSVAIVLASLASALAACDSRPTAPAELRVAPMMPAAIVGDTTACQRGWVIITGAYVCNP